MSYHLTERFSFTTPVFSKNLGHDIYYARKDNRPLLIMLVLKRLLTTPLYGKNRRHI
ncbi:MAG: hypothetical protein HZC01_02075 [Candidatus Kerfeldbacteria bacterium]|nr:hypothetical protein [Candidatus Kerfeldbacteria bacterium]